ncbi:non-transporter ABC protein AbcF1 [Pelomyxa schiedti]|nr:non-transporter ABC protein AbcF1 [Pelomyxa schiedti]
MPKKGDKTADKGKATPAATDKGAERKRTGRAEPAAPTPSSSTGRKSATATTAASAAATKSAPRKGAPPAVAPKKGRAPPKRRNREESDEDEVISSSPSEEEDSDSGSEKGSDAEENGGSGSDSGKGKEKAEPEVTSGRARLTMHTASSTITSVGSTSAVSSRVPEYVHLKGHSGNRGRDNQKDIVIDDITVTVPGKELIRNCSLKLAHGRAYGLVGRNGLGKTVLLRCISERDSGTSFGKIPANIRILHVQQEVEGDDRTPLETVLSADIERDWLMTEANRLEEKEKADAIVQEQRAKRRADRKVRREAELAKRKAEEEEARKKAAEEEEARRKSEAAAAAEQKNTEAAKKAEIAKAKAMRAKEEADEELEEIERQLAELEAEEHARDDEDKAPKKGKKGKVSSDDEIQEESDSAPKKKGGKGRRKGVEDDEDDLPAKKGRGGAAKGGKRRRGRGDDSEPEDTPAKKPVPVPAKRGGKGGKRGGRRGRDDSDEEEPPPAKPVPTTGKKPGTTAPSKSASVSTPSTSASAATSSTSASAAAPATAAVSVVNTTASTTAAKPTAIAAPPVVPFKSAVSDDTASENDEDELGYGLPDIYSRLREIDAHKAEPRAATILAGLGFEDEEMRTKRTREYSGGWRMRISLAQALFMQPDLLILDEPTNHLDLQAVIWLEAYLSMWRNTLLLVSHDASFLNSTCDNIVHLHMQTLTQFKGDYDSFVKARRQNKVHAAKEADKAKKAKKKLTDLAGRNREQAKDRLKKAAKVAAVEEDREELPPTIEFPDPGVLGDVCLLQFQDVSFGYEPDNLLFRNLEFGIYLNSRIGLVGPNGVGKSTLMKLMCGDLVETSGQVTRYHGLSLARFHQHHVDQLNMEMNPVEYIRSKFPTAQVQDIRQFLGKFGLKGSTALQSIASLSGGQKSRLVFAELSWSHPHIILLDEPTNHLDMDTIEVLIQATREFRGGVVLITHHQRLIEAACDEIWMLRPGGIIERFDGDFAEYKKAIMTTMPPIEFEGDA